MQFRVKTIDNKNIKDELLKVGFDEKYVDFAVKKHCFLSIKIQNLPFYCATIIKEAALSKGCDAGINRGVLVHSVDFSDLILSGTIKQLEEVAKSLMSQPFKLDLAGKRILEEIELSKKEKVPQIMGILNVTENSFSDGGKYLNPKKAIEHALEMADEGAEIIDIGAESTKPNSKPVDVDLEIERLVPVVCELKKSGLKISVDTRNSKTAKVLLDKGVEIINDVSGLSYDPKMINAVKNSNCRIVIMHSIGTPETMDSLNNYNCLEDDIFNTLYERIEFAHENGISKERIIIDTGFGFAKNVEQNFKLLEKIKEFNSLEVQTLAGVSRKRFLASLLEDKDNETLDELTMLASFYLAQNGADIIRVHNVKKTKLALELYKSIYLQKPCP